jgi:LAO/AO transport system kinase
VWQAVERHRAWLVSTGELARRRRRRLASEVAGIVTRRLHARTAPGAWPGFERLVDAVATGRLDPYSAAGEILIGLG